MHFIGVGGVGMAESDVGEEILRCSLLQVRGKRWYNTGMTIKKIKPIKPAAKTAAPSAAGDDPATMATTVVPSGPMIADRFKLDAPDQNAKKGSVGKKAATAALVAALVALAVAGILTFVLYQHWDFLCNQVA